MSKYLILLVVVAALSLGGYSVYACANNSNCKTQIGILDVVTIITGPVCPEVAQSIDWKPVDSNTPIDLVLKGKSNDGSSIEISGKKGETIFFRNLPVSGGKLYYDIVGKTPGGRELRFTRFLNDASADVYTWVWDEAGIHVFSIDVREGNGPYAIQFSENHPSS